MHCNFGKELILDMHDCDTQNFNRKGLKRYFDKLCELIDMNQEKICFWDYEGDPEGYEAAPVHLKGISAIQFITTSNITIHTLDSLKQIYLNIFSCKDFDPEVVKLFTLKFFGGVIIKQTCIDRI